MTALCAVRNCRHRRTTSWFFEGSNAPVTLLLQLQENGGKSKVSKWMMSRRGEEWHDFATDLRLFGAGCELSYRG
jgi:hypothetical protein